MKTCRATLPFALLLTAPVITACGREEAASHDVAQALSEGLAPTLSGVDGIETWDYPTNALDITPQFTIDASPSATFGGSEGDPAYDLTHLSTATLLHDGRVATLSSIGARLLLFAADGRAERSFGRQGEGPGEFMRPSGLLPAGGDSLVVVDDANLQISWILPNKGVTAQRAVAPGGADRMHQAIGVLASGTIVMSGTGIFQDAEPDGVTRPPADVGILSPRDGATRVIAAVPDLQMVLVETRYRGRSRMMSVPLRLGSGAQVAAWDSLIVTSGEGAVLDLRDTSGTVVRRLVLPGARQPVTGAMRQAAIEAELARIRQPRREQMVDPAESERLAREWPFADSLPMVGRLVVSLDGLLWVVDPAAPGDDSWGATAIARNGTLVARLTGGTGIPMAFGSGMVLVRREDPDGIVSLTRHRIVPR